MSNDVLAIALAGFMHDIGKFIQRIAKDSNIKLPDNFDKQKYQPKDSRTSSGYSHVHASYTAYFIKNVIKEIPEINDIDKFVDLAAKHHIDSNEKDEFIINIADRISAGMDRTENIEKENSSYNDWIKIRLKSIFDEIDNNNTKYQYSLAEFTETSVFPEQITDKTSDYSTIANGFYKDLENLPKTNLKDWFVEFDKLNKKWTSFIPSVTITAIPDISLYDHERTTSAIAQALYVYHKEKNDFVKEHIKSNDTEKKLLFFKAKFNGIQNFIFATGGQTNKNAAKILRGRSFYISLLMKRVCSMLCDKLGLAHTAIIMNAAGSITAILPNTQTIKDKINVIKDEINNWLIKQFYGETSISFAYIEITGDDLKNKLSDIGTTIAKKLEAEKFKKIPLNKMGVIEDYFNEDEVLCKFCGKKPAKKQDKQENIKCDVCKDLIKIGENLVTKKQFDLLIPIFDTYKTIYSQDYDNLYVPKTENGFTKDFQQIIGDDKKGINALGVLKADVDNLGLLFRKISQKGGISRQVTFSRMLDAFWTLWLPKELEKNYSNIYTVFSGGDDLFLIGKWDEIIDFAFELKKKFNEYTCNNPNISFSAGIAILKPGEPINDFYSLSENALEKSKDFDGKNAITLFNETISWNYGNEILENFKNIENLIEQNKLNSAALTKLLIFINMAKKTESFNENISININDMQNLKWKALLAYYISRNDKVKKDKEKQNLINSFVEQIDDKTKRKILKTSLWKNIYKNRIRRK